MRSGLALGLLFCSSIAIGCKAQPDDGKPTRDECAKASERVADIIVEYNVANPEQWWDAIHAEPGNTGLPGGVTRESFRGYLDSPEGKTWLMTRKGATLTGTQQMIDRCVEVATKPQVRCLVAAKTKEDVAACDTKHARKGSATPTSDPSTGSASGAGSASTP